MEVAMPEKPDQESINQWHRWFAKECNNRAWDLIAMSERTPAQTQELLYLAYSAAYHWSQIGLPINQARADITLAHAHSVSGLGTQALIYARRALLFCEQNECEDWDLAFAHAEMALAAAASRDQSLFAQHYAKAKTCGEAIAEDEDRQVFFDEFKRIPTSVV
jgi:hypothetical protein